MSDLNSNIYYEKYLKYKQKYLELVDDLTIKSMNNNSCNCGSNCSCNGKCKYCNCKCNGNGNSKCKCNKL